MNKLQQVLRFLINRYCVQLKRSAASEFNKMLCLTDITYCCSILVCYLGKLSVAKTNTESVVGE